MDKDLKKVVVLLAHPNMENSQANKALLDAIKDIEDVAIFNLYEMLEQDILNMDAWSRIISHANAVVYQFPFYWIHWQRFRLLHKYICAIRVHGVHWHHGSRC